jgi:hypothetical protein
LEARFEEKEREIEGLNEVCNQYEAENRQLGEQVAECHQCIRDQDAQIEGFREEAQFFRDKMEEMQGVIDQCSLQMMDFDAINKMSSALIEQLQTEVDHYRSQGNLGASQPSQKQGKDYTFQRRGHFNDSIQDIQQSFVYHHGPLVFKSSHLLGSPLTASQGLGQQENTIKEIAGYLEPAMSLTPERGGRFSHAKEQQPTKQQATLATSDSLPKFHATNHMARMQPLVDISNTHVMNRSESSSRILGMSKYNLPLQMPPRKTHNPENSLGLRNLIDSSIAKLEMDHEKVSPP